MKVKKILIKYVKKIIKNWPYLLLIGGSIAMILPFYWSIITSFKLPAEVIAYPPTWIPKEPTLRNYSKLFEKLPVMRLYFNSLFLSITITVLVLFTSSLIGYVFAKFYFPGRNIIFIMILGTMMIPFYVTMIPLYILMVRLKWVDTYQAIVAPAIYSSFGIFLMRQWMHSIPNDILDAARIDGCREFGIFRKIILPLSKPALSALGIFQFIWSWNNFLWPLIILNTQELWTLPVGLATFQGQWWTDYALTMAGAAVSVVPLIIAFILLQKRITKGIVLTGMKI